MLSHCTNRSSEIHSVQRGTCGRQLGWRRPGRAPPLVLAHQPAWVCGHSWNWCWRVPLALKGFLYEFFCSF